ncbi:MAG: YitT family protein [Pyramidobacter sp.]|nr:YitT family protein [Pyramidobacter sp.]
MLSKNSAAELLRREFLPFCSITVGTLLVCVGVAALIEPYRFASSGVTGLALIPSYLWGVPPVWIITAANALLLIWGWKALSPRFALWTLYNTVLTSLALPLREAIRYPIMSSPILAALFGGVVGGLGMGIMFCEGGSSGGMDVVAAVARKRWGLDVGSASFFANVAVLVLSLAAVDLEHVLLGALNLYVESVVIDWVIKSFDRRTQLTIISSEPDMIVEFIMKTLDRTATLISAKGAYRREPMDMIMVILTRRQAVELKRFVRAVDRRAFVIMGDVAEVVGEGFKKWESDS